jgi:ABC-type branched-subunit amino acid transport system ATPase component
MSGEAMGTDKVVLEARDVHAFYGKSHILHGVSLRLDEGEIVTVLGRNGAGKTTTMRSLMGLTAVREGSVRMLGEDTTRWPAYRIARLGVGYVPEGRKIFGNLTVLENLSPRPSVSACTRRCRCPARPLPQHCSRRAPSPRSSAASEPSPR